MKKIILFFSLSIFTVLQPATAQRDRINKTIPEPSQFKGSVMPALSNLKVANTNFTAAPCGLAISPKGKVAVSEYVDYGKPGNISIWNSLDDFKANKAANFIIKDIISPEALVFDNQDRLYITETEYGNNKGATLHRFVQNGTTWVEQGGYNNKGWNPGTFANPRGTAIKDQTIYLANDDKGTVVACEMNGHEAPDYISGLSAPKAVAIHGAFLAVAEFKGNKVSFWSLDTKQKVGEVAVSQPVDLVWIGSELVVSSIGYGLKVFESKATQTNTLTVTPSTKSFENVGQIWNSKTVWGMAIAGTMAKLGGGFMESGQQRLFITDPGNKRVIYFE